MQNDIEIMFEEFLDGYELDADLSLNELLFEVFCAGAGATLEALGGLGDEEDTEEGSEGSDEEA